jgi:hypothetical protein
MRLFRSVACVDVNAVGDTTSFAEKVAVNRGFPVRVCATVEAAEMWLLREQPPVSPLPP